MSDREPYSYTVLRYVHDIMSGEFVNVGVVLHAVSGLKSKFRSTYGRVSSVFPSLDERAFKETLRTIHSSIEKLEKIERSAGLFQSTPDALAFARKALVSDDSSFQWSSAGSGVSRDVSTTLDQLFERFVTRHEKHTARRRNDADVWRPIREQLEELKVADRFEERTFKGTVDEIKLDHAWKNGKWHAIEAVSFDLADAEGVRTKAHRIRGHLDSVADGLTEDFSLNLVLGLPENPDLMSAYQAACRILEKAAVQPKVFDENQASVLLAHLADEIRAHDKKTILR